jgi:toluene monooxygenase system protein D
MTEIKMVGPVIRGADGDLAEAVIAAMETDNPGVELQVDDQGGYIRVSAPQRCRVTRASLETELGTSFPLARLEPALSGFAGRMRVTDDQIEWYLERMD